MISRKIDTYQSMDPVLLPIDPMCCKPNYVPKGLYRVSITEMDGRTTTLSFDDYQSDSFQVCNGLDQGDPASGGFLFRDHGDL